VAPPSTKSSRPARLLAFLVVLILGLLAAIIGNRTAQPASWHQSFKVGLGLDLSSGTTVTLRAVAPRGHQPSPAAMKQAASIMLSRVNGAGFTGAQVQQQGNDIITVSVPGRGAKQVVGLVGTTALLRFRQVLLEAQGYPVPTTVPAPSTSPSTGTSPSTSTSPSPGTSPSSSSTAKAAPKPSSSSSSTKAAGNGTGQAAAAGSLSAARAAPQASPSPSSSPTSSASASPSGTASSTPAIRTVLPTTADASGNAALVGPAVRQQFNQLNCRDPKWQAKIYGNDPARWDSLSSQIVACDAQGNKFALDVAKVTGEMLTKSSAGLDQSNGQWVVNFNLNGQGTKAFGTLTAAMYSRYYSASSSLQNVLDDFAIVLDGKVISAPQVIAPITGGQGQITGGGTSGFTQGQVNSLVNVLKYGSLPLTFQKESITTVSPQLGASQLRAGLIAAAVGLLLVVIYSFLYYRGLGVVSVSSLAIAALLSYVAVVLLSKYEGFTLSLAGVAGLIVAIGITADSFVVYFERLRDEVREGRSLRAAVERGWRRARRTILVSDTVSFLAAALLYLFAIGDVKGFAFTLGLTTLIDVVVVFLFTKPMVTLLARTKFYGDGHRLSGLDPARLGARSPWRGSRRPAARPAAGATSAGPARTTPKEA
jgi:preprotein translocase subunit SecD